MVSRPISVDLVAGEPECAIGAGCDTHRLHARNIEFCNLARGADAANFVGAEEGEPEGIVRANRDTKRDTFRRGDRIFRDLAIRGDAADLVGAVLNKPERAVRSGYHADGDAVCLRQRILCQHLTVCAELDDLVRLHRRHPQRVVRPRDHFAHRR